MVSSPSPSFLPYTVPLWLADAFPRWLRLSRRVVAPSLSNPFWARTRAASPRLNAMQLAAAALRTSLYKKEAQNDHSIVEASSEDLAQIDIVLSLGESRPCPRECDPACPACPISGCLRSCPPSTTGAEAITFDRPFEHDKKLPVLADVVRTPS